MILRIYHKSIKAKLASAVAVPLAVAVAIAGFALFKFNMLSHAFHDVVEKDVPVAQAALHAEVELYGISRAEAWLALSSDPEQLRRAEAAYEYERKAVDKILAELNERADPAALTKLETFEKGWQTHLTLSSQLREMLNAGNNEEARAFAMGPLADSVNGLKSQLETLSEYKQEEMAASMSEVDASFQSATMMMIGAIVIGAAIAVFLGIVIARGILGAILPVINRAQRIAEQDLSGEELAIKTQDEIGSLTSAINEMWSSLRNIVSDVRASSSEVAAAATEVAASSEEMASGTERQSRSVTEVASALEEMSASITEVADKSTNAARDADDAGKLAQSGGEIVQKSIQGMNEIDSTVTASATAVEELGKQSEQIGEVIEVINEIAEQTNLLALNAAIEAARAGEHGRGFAVVADEVRKLADRTTKATMEIAESITAMQSGTAQAVERMRKGTEEVKVGVDRANEAGDSLSSIVASSQGVGALVRSIAAAAEQQSAASTQISRSVQEISAVSRETSEAVSQSSQAANELSQKAERLQELVAGFRI